MSRKSDFKEEKLQELKTCLDFLVSMCENENKNVLDEKRILENKISSYLTFTSIILSFLVGVIVYIYPWRVNSGSEEFLTVSVWFFVIGVFFWEQWQLSLL